MQVVRYGADPQVAGLKPGDEWLESLWSFGPRGFESHPRRQSDHKNPEIRCFGKVLNLKTCLLLLGSYSMTEATEEKTAETSSEKLPLSEFYKVIDYVTIFKSNKWWEAVVAIESYGKRSIAMYMWQSMDGKWKRKHKFQIRGVDEWNKVKNSVEQLLPKLQK